MRLAVSLEDGLGLSGDRCMRDTPTSCSCTVGPNYSEFSYNKHPVTQSKFLYTKVIDRNVSKKSIQLNANTRPFQQYKLHVQGSLSSDVQPEQV